MSAKTKKKTRSGTKTSRVKAGTRKKTVSRRRHETWFSEVWREFRAYMRVLSKAYVGYGRKRHGARKSRSRSLYNDRWTVFAWAVPALAVILTISVLVRPKTQFPIALTSAKLISLFQRAQPQDVGDRIAFWSNKLLKNPSLLAPLGSGPDINDTAPLFPRGYDCTTYVETVAALARSHDGKDLADQLIRIRYRKGRISFENRNHFPEADWIPNNVSVGILKDITLRVARKSGFVASFANKDIYKMAWFKKQRNTHAKRYVAASGGSDEEPHTVKLPYIPLDKVMSAVQHMPQGAVINVVRANRERHPTLVTHQGFLVWKNGVAYFRHASPNKEITEMPLVEYVRYASKQNWKILGLNINVFRG